MAFSGSVGVSERVLSAVWKVHRSRVSPRSQASPNTDWVAWASPSNSPPVALNPARRSSRAAKAVSVMGSGLLRAFITGLGSTSYPSASLRVLFTATA